MHATGTPSADVLGMKKSTLTMVLALAPLAIQPACASDNEGATDDELTEHAATSASALLGGSKLAWPMQDGKATIRVCWLPLDLGGETLPGGSFAVDPAKVLPERKQWIREGVEREWNGKTVLNFVGWQDCGAGDADIRIQPMARRATPTCGVSGSFCVEKIGLPDRGKRVFINVLFGDESLGEARYLQTVTRNTVDLANILQTNGQSDIYTPAICGTEMRNFITHFTNNQPVTATDLSDIQRVYKDCLQNVSNHEFGHLAGFSHEQNRKDVSAACAKQYAAAMPDDPSDEDSPLGTFEEDSIMSYCRTTLPGTLTAEDVAQTNAFYAKNAPKLPPSKAAPKSEGTSDPQTGSDPTGDPESPEPPPAPAKKKKPSVVSASKGGCNG